MTGPEPARGRRLVAPVLTIGGLGLATLGLHLRDPHEQGSWGYCPSYYLFGVYCPGCGGLRAVNDLTDGRLADALSSNLVVTLGIPLVSLGLALWALDRWRGRVGRWRAVLHQRPVQYAVVAALLLFAVVRNLPGSWLAP